VAPRDAFPRLQRSRILKPVDEEPVWSVVCLYVARAHRRTGVSKELLRAALEHVRQRSGRIVEGYAVEPRKDEIPDIYGYHGLAAAYRAAGFVEVARRSATRPIMRCRIA
jgi:GNAT superfamily N-acetyltransferase